jgi:hypothetical protein
MSEPHEEADEPNLHPGPRDEGGEGGMATRELAAQEEDDEDDRQSSIRQEPTGA